MKNIPEYNHIPNSVDRLTTEEVTGRVLEVLTDLAHRVHTQGVTTAQWSYRPEYVITNDGCGDVVALEFNIMLRYHSSEGKTNA